MTSFNRTFGRGFSNNSTSLTPLTLDAVKLLAPSAFATEAHESRSDRFAYIPTSEVIEAMIKNGFQPYKATQGGSRIEGKRDFTKHMIRFRHESQTGLVVGDSLSEVIMINAHDGTSRYKLLAGIFKLACLNGMVVAESTTGSISVAHKGNIMDQVVEGSFQIIEGAKKAMEVVKEWSGLQLTNGEQNLLAESAHDVRFADDEGKVNTSIQPSQLLQVNRSADNKNDLYTVFNRIQENTVRGGLHNYNRTTRRRETTRSVKGIDQDVKLNRALWKLAEGMAALKTGGNLVIA